MGSTVCVPVGRAESVSKGTKNILNIRRIRKEKRRSDAEIAAKKEGLSTGELLFNFFRK
jgi:hypothetical protein